jgi:hypothetical protein
MNTAILEEKNQATPASPAKKPRAAKQRAHVAPPKTKSGRKATGARSAAAGPSGSKTAKILDLLRRPDGASLKDLMKATSWQPHSVRGFLSGTVGKKMKTPVESFKRSDGARAYRISFK